jgi:hypothetical protein
MGNVMGSAVASQCSHRREILIATQEVLLDRRLRRAAGARAPR